MLYYIIFCDMALERQKAVGCNVRINDLAAVLQYPQHRHVADIYRQLQTSVKKAPPIVDTQHKKSGGKTIRPHRRTAKHRV